MNHISGPTFSKSTSKKRRPRTTHLRYSWCYEQPAVGSASRRTFHKSRVDATDHLSPNKSQKKSAIFLRTLTNSHTRISSVVQRHFHGKIYIKKKLGHEKNWETQERKVRSGGRLKPISRKPRLADSFGFIEPAVYIAIWTKCYMDGGHFCTTQNLRAAAKRELVLASNGDVILHCEKRDCGQ